MPYIKQEDRKEIDLFLSGIFKKHQETLFDQLYEVLYEYVSTHQQRYQTYNDIIGAIVCSTKEVHRRFNLPFRGAYEKKLEKKYFFTKDLFAQDTIQEESIIIKTPGALNYALSMVMARFISNNKESVYISFSICAETLCAIESLEQSLAEYEDRAIALNGDCFGEFLTGHITNTAE